MFLDTLGGVFPLAVGIALSPMPIVAVILMLATPRAMSNSLAFSAGWLGGLIAILVVGVAIGSGSSTADETPSTFSNWLKLVLGLAFIVLGPVVLYVVKRDAAASTLSAVKNFMAVHNRAIMTVLLFVFGAKLLGEGLPAVIKG